MNGYQRIQAAIRGEWPDVVPVMLHNFQVAAHEAGVSMGTFRRNPREMARAFIEAAEKYDLDGILVDVDTAALAGAVGVPVELPEDDAGRCEGGLLDSIDGVERLVPVDISKYWVVQNWLEGVRLVKRHFGNEKAVRGNCDQCPFSLASMVRTPTAWMVDLLDEQNRRHVVRLLEYCTDVSCQFIELMASTGCDMLSNGDSPAGPDLISPAMYRKFALPYERRVAAKAAASNLPHFLHICGNTTGILADMLETNSAGFDIDFKTDLEAAHTAFRDRVVFCGNIEPVGVLQRGSTAQVEEESRRLLHAFSDTPRFILNSGCVIPPSTPSENLHALVGAAHAWK
jgi:uroporphyrinogen decarboxylase